MGAGAEVEFRQGLFQQAAFFLAQRAERFDLAVVHPGVAFGRGVAEAFRLALPGFGRPLFYLGGTLRRSMLSQDVGRRQGGDIQVDIDSVSLKKNLTQKEIKKSNKPWTS